EEILKQAAADVLGVDCFDEGEFLQRVDHIEACPNKLLSFVFKGGRTADCYWKDRSRSESWTPQMKDKARQNALRRHVK
ncbi:MAG: recombinase family protein, partial [Eubacteriales bacterium]|nr:recombinase family protein [Eubacteriales bacterium]